MSTAKDFSVTKTITPALFSDPECPSWAKCVVMNADGTITFLDTIPQKYNGKLKKWFFPNWRFVRFLYYSRRGIDDCRKSLLVRENAK